MRGGLSEAMRWSKLQIDWSLQMKFVDDWKKAISRTPIQGLNFKEISTTRHQSKKPSLHRINSFSLLGL
jgi:hypothetical protein